MPAFQEYCTLPYPDPLTITTRHGSETPTIVRATQPSLTGMLYKPIHPTDTMWLSVVAYIILLLANSIDG